MGATPLPHNPLNGVTAGVWREGDQVRKRLTGRGAAPDHWAASEDPRHWNFWRREALVYQTGLPARLGLGAPELLDARESADGDVELLLEAVEGRHGAGLGVEDLAAAAQALGRAQGCPEQPDAPWLSRGFLRAYSSTRKVRWELLDDDVAWARPLVAEHFGPALREGLVDLHRRRERLLAMAEALPRTVCHLDVWPNNLIRRPGGEVVLLDWAFTGDGALGEDVGNLVPDAVFDGLLGREHLDALDAAVTQAYLAGLREAGWRGDERLVRLGICASAVKYDWLAALDLERAAAAEQRAYGGGVVADAGERFADHAAGLALCVRWAREAERLAEALGR